MLESGQLQKPIAYDDEPSQALPDGFAPSVLIFRDFQVWPTSRLLLQSGQVVCIGSRAFDLLVILVQSRGSVVGKSDLMKHVWPSTIVDESNLRFQIATLRTALGKDRDLIKSVPGRGYFFACDPKIDTAATQGSPQKKNVGWIESTATGDAPQGFDDRLRSRLWRGTVETSRNNDKAINLFVHFAQQLVDVYGSLESAQDALSLVTK